MKKFLLGLFTVCMPLFLVFGYASATPISSSSLQQILNNITVGPNPGVSSVNVNTDQLTFDSYWMMTASGGSLATFIIELADFASTNTFGLYDGTDSTKLVQVFSGSASTGDQALVSIKADGRVIVNFVDTGIVFAGNNFGFYLKTNDPSQQATFFSDTSLNGDNVDHLVAFQGKNIDTVQLPTFLPGLWTDNEYILAWEDLSGGGDRDYDDMVLMVESVKPVPEPGTLILLGSGLAGIGLLGRRKFLSRKS